MRKYTESKGQPCFVINSISAPTSAILESFDAFADLAIFPTSKSNAILFTRPSSIWLDCTSNKKWNKILVQHLHSATVREKDGQRQRQHKSDHPAHPARIWHTVLENDIMVQPIYPVNTKFHNYQINQKFKTIQKWI